MGLLGESAAREGLNGRLGRLAMVPVSGRSWPQTRELAPLPHRRSPGTVQISQFGTLSAGEGTVGFAAGLAGAAAFRTTGTSSLVDSNDGRFWIADCSGLKVNFVYRSFIEKLE